MVRSTRRRRVPGRKHGVRKPKANFAKRVLKVVRGASETKEASFFGTAGTFPQTGLYNDRAYSSQNQSITTVVGDVKIVLPYVLSGNEDWQRIGNKIQPLSLRIMGTTKVSLANTSPPLWSPTDIFAVCYILQSKQIKSYSNFLNNSTATNYENLRLDGLLKTEEGNTAIFDGNIWASRLPVADQNFTVLSKKILRLRYAGLTGSGGGVTSIANSHDYVANWSVTLRPGKHMPKTLVYPEPGTTALLPPTANSPTNFAPFMVMGFYQADASPSGPPSVILQNTYTSLLRYKDI